MEFTLNLDINEFSKKGMHISDSSFKKFIHDFNDDLLIHSQDEGGGKLQFWYEPLQQFIPFYRP